MDQQGNSRDSTFLPYKPRTVPVFASQMVTPAFFVRRSPQNAELANCLFAPRIKGQVYRWDSDGIKVQPTMSWAPSARICLIALVREIVRRCDFGRAELTAACSQQPKMSRVATHEAQFVCQRGRDLNFAFICGRRVLASICYLFHI